jgi:hypothetical protein
MVKTANLASSPVSIRQKEKKIFFLFAPLRGQFGFRGGFAAPAAGSRGGLPIIAARR